MDCKNSHDVLSAAIYVQIIFCGGRLVLGPDVKNVVVTLVLTVAPMVLFFVFVGRYLMKDFPHHGGIAIMVMAVIHTFFVSIVFFFPSESISMHLKVFLMLSLNNLIQFMLKNHQVITCLLLTTCRDPGILPRNDRKELIESEENGTRQLTIDEIVNGKIVKRKYCDTCHFYRPLRCSHCSVCNNCVERFDHHCPWLGQCVGKVGYFFLLFKELEIIVISFSGKPMFL